MSYSRFHLADLHVHTTADPYHKYGADAGGSEPSEPFARRLVEAHAAAGVTVVAVTDHNRADWYPLLREAGRRVGVTVFPGVEISVNRCHLIGLWDCTKRGHELTEQFISAVFRPGEARVANGAPRPVTSGQPRDIAERIRDHQGLVLAPHATAKANGIFGAGICSNSSELARSDLIAGFDVCNNKGADVLGNPRSEFGSVDPRWFLSGDVRSLDQIGQRAIYLKLGSKPTLEGIRQAFLVPHTRIRFPIALESDWGRVKGVRFRAGLDPTWPRLTGIRVDGGFHDGLDVALAPGLNAIIGGKGTGKSALIEILRHVVGRTPAESTDLQENLRRNFRANADAVVHFVDDGGVEYEARRSGGTAAAQLVRNGAPSDVALSRRLKLHIYGQRELAELASSANLRKFIADQMGDAWQAAMLEDRQLRGTLNDQSGQLATLETTLAGLSELEQEHSDLKERVERARHHGAGELLREAQRLAKADAQIRSAARWPAVVRDAVVGVRQDQLPAPQLPAAHAPPEGLAALVSELEQALVTHLDSATASAVAAETGTPEILARWQITHAAARADLERRLAEAGIKNAQELSRWQTRIGELDADLSDMPGREAARADLEGQREAVLGALWKMRRNNSRLTEQGANDLNAALSDRVRLLVSPLDDSSLLRRALDQALRGQSVRGEQITRLAEMEPTQLARAIRRGTEALVKLGISASTAAKLVGLDPSVLRGLEVTDTPDLIELQINLATGGSAAWRPVSEVSPGQRATALLALVLASGDEPLIIDQPEDDLDNRYIYEEVVSVLARVCEHRQVIVATHNANVPILGDAELIIALDASAAQSKVIACGGLEESAVALQARQILEGGDEAFRARRRRYSTAD